jgi:hypothetical protein
MTIEVFTEDHLVAMNAALEQFKDVDEVLARAKQAGVDLGTLEDRAIASRDQIAKLKQAFFPGR